jgi:hypothetical protein
LAAATIFDPLGARKLVRFLLLEMRLHEPVNPAYREKHGKAAEENRDPGRAFSGQLSAISHRRCGRLLECCWLGEHRFPIYKSFTKSNYFNPTLRESWTVSL